MTYSIYEMKKKILPSYLKGFLKKKEEEWRFHIFFYFRDINVFSNMQIRKVMTP